MNKWTKIPCSLHWTLHEIDIKQEVNSDFQFSWSRGESKGESDIMKPDSKNKLVFNSDFEVPCTIYINKMDGSIKPKKLKVVLKRFLDGGKTKIFGKLTIDVSNFYGNKVITKFNKEMESGRGTPPIFSASFLLFAHGEVTDTTGADLNDMSFLGEQDKHVPLQDWDITEIEQDDEDSDEAKEKRRKHKHKHKKDDSKSDKKDKKKKKKKDKSKSKDEKRKDKKKKKSGDDSPSKTSSPEKEVTPAAGVSFKKETDSTESGSGVSFKKETDSTESGSGVSFKKETDSTESGSGVSFKKETDSTESGSGVSFKKETDATESGSGVSFKREIDSTESGSGISFKRETDATESGSGVSFKKETDSTESGSGVSFKRETDATESGSGVSFKKETDSNGITFEKETPEEKDEQSEKGENDDKSEKSDKKKREKKKHHKKHRKDEGGDEEATSKKHKHKKKHDKKDKSKKEEDTQNDDKGSEQQENQAEKETENIQPDEEIMNQVDSEKADGKEVEEKNDNRTKVEAEIENKDDENEDDEVNKEGDEENKEDEEEESESSSSEVTDDDDDDDEKKLFTKEAIASRKSDEEMMLASPEFCFHKLLTSEYPHIRNPPLMSPPNKCPCPASLFVIISMFLQTKFLEDNEISDAHFDSCLSVFIAEFPTIPLTTAKKLSLTMLLYMFCSDNRMFSKSKTEQFVNSLKPIFEKQFNRYLSRFVNRTEVLINRFATATFEFDHLLADFREIISGTANTFSKFGSDDMNRLLNDRFLYLFQIKLLNKIISNPSRFNFTNSMIWNSFLTAVENDERISLDVLRQAISGLIMASNISTSPDLSDDVCPSIPKPLIAFFLKNYQKDENITNELKTKDFLKVYKISKIPQTYEEMKPKPNTIEWKALKENILIGNWNKIDKDEPIASFYPFLSRYVA